MAAQRREDISVAFGNSSYPTPYGDNTIPGDHPGCRHKRLGRQYAPLPINKSSLTTDLHVPGCGLGRHGPVLPADINNHIQHTLLIRDTHNSNYVLDSERGGKRHFAEQRGSEQPWSPSLRRLVPIMSGDAPLLPQRRAIGVYNPTMPGPELKKSLEQREREAARQQVGKAHVNRPPDHHPLDLVFFYVPTDSARLPSQDDNPAAAASPPMDASPAPALQDLEGERCHAEASAPDESLFFSRLAFASPSIDDSRMRGAYLGTRRPSIKIADKGKGSTIGEMRRQAEAAQARLEDIRLVQLLPKL
ncbi:hypothetical protein C3747_48g142 [Trypanosoma cruzi]|uniref:Uncharacterized protein n=2 Tax=Trypanosoma cruzi TaxID=5693 RepID=Q4DI19_TRYCC|nr:hypothetical protein, conserved [Trypanosoma cruzi]EAN92171.1 hypothetical protein, conserved [Trypanosoma cruzi]PWV12813.1 hypothetical protein C3747_48g142 [Trypanosoma cruzi]RNC37575.1 hypothetical protein TcCL_NonESM13253 [Trypanosoma cruzi]|eukprot:XP_814022.1 hypothetical protein [Trypanosoma cruzi strain CL Brener]